jgi:DNA repair protein RecN (Recombination protein N)
VLLELHLRDLGVVAEAGVELSGGLNVVTGETGVGKTLLVTSLGLLTGARGSARLVREGAGEAVVQAVVAPSPALRTALAAHGAPDDEDLILVRRLGADGRSRAWIGGQLAPVSTLAEFGEALVEVHGQGAGFALARPATQLAAVDALAGNDAQLATYRTALVALRELEREREALRQGESTREREADLLRHQADEIERAALEPDEDTRIAAMLSRLEHAERLGSLGAEVVDLAGTDGAAGALAEAHRSLESAVALDPELAPLVSKLGELAAEVSELIRDVRAWCDTLDADPAQLEGLRERKALIAGLKRRYGATLDDVIVAGSEASERLQQLEGADERIATIDADVARARSDVERAGAELTKRRRRAAKQLAKLVGAELPALALPNAVFDVRCDAGPLTESGADIVAFVFASSRSKTPEPIGKIASGGELSRAMIAVTLALAASHDVPVLVFDEADQGVGGEAALELARRLSRLGRTHQVLVVSHLPQIAAFADHHVAVRRDGDDVQVDVLDAAGRLAELSRMLAGLGSSELARAHAAELLQLAASERDAATTSARAG